MTNKRAQGNKSDHRQQRQGSLGDKMVEAGISKPKSARKPASAASKGGTTRKQTGSYSPKSDSRNTPKRRRKRGNRKMSPAKKDNLNIKPDEEVLSVKKKDGVTYVRTKPKNDNRHPPHLKKKSHPVKRQFTVKKIEPDTLLLDGTASLGKIFDVKLEEYPFAGYEPTWSYYEINPDGEVPVVIGLDFGTAFTKVVASLEGRETSWVIPLSTNPNNQFIINSEVYLYGKNYSLEPGGTRISGLKEPFISGSLSIDHVIHTTAFISLVVDYVMQWIQNERRGDLRGIEPYWIVNIGLPARNFEEKELVGRYLKMAWAALSLLEDGTRETTRPGVASKYEQAFGKDGNGLDLGSGKKKIIFSGWGIAVYPEIMAQLFGFLKSRFWDEKQPEFMLVDIGGGTVDSAIFNVVKDKTSGELNFNLFKSGVQQKGTMKLHKSRLDWIKTQLEALGATPGLIKELQQERVSGGEYWLIPDKVDDYLTGARFGAYTIDDQIIDEIKSTLFGEQLRFVLKEVDPLFCRQQRNYRLILVGGGSENALYGTIPDQGNVFRGVGVDRVDLPIPDNLQPRLTRDVYYRISVAHGLAFEDLGELITPDKIKELTMKPDSTQSRPYQDKYVSKDDV